MKKLIKHSGIIWFLAAAFLSTAAISQNTAHYIIASGSEGGNYFKTGQYIADRYTQAFNVEFTSIPSNGTLENIELLKNNTADFAIVQRNVLINSLYNKQSGINNVEVIIPLFEEKLWIYTKSTEPVSITTFKQNLSGRHLKIGFTSKSGYSYQLFSTIAKLLNITGSAYEEQFEDYTGLIEDFINGNLDYLVSFSLPLTELENLDKVSYVYFENEQISFVESRIPNLFVTRLTDGRQKHYSLGSWAFLIGLKNKIGEFADQEKLLTALLSGPNTKYQHQYLTKERFRNFTNEKSANKYINGIPLHYVLEREISKPSGFMYYKTIALVVLPLLLLTGIYFLISKGFLRFRLLHLWVRYKHIIIGSVAVVVVYFASGQALRISEEIFHRQMGIKSQLLNLSDTELNLWLLITNLTSIDNGIFPISTGGKLILSFNAYIFWIGTIFIALSEFIAYQLSAKRKKGLMQIKFNQHIVIIGWNANSYAFINNIMTATGELNKRNMKVVCIVPSPTEILERDKRIKDLHLLKKIHFVKGEARDTHTLEKANIHNAHSVILLAEDHSPDADERTLLRALSISRFCRSKTIEHKYSETRPAKLPYKLYKTGEYIDSIYIIAEINNPAIKDDLIASDVNEVIVTSSYGRNTIIQSMFNHGVSKALDEVLEFNKFNEFYIIDLSKTKYKHLLNKTFDELLLPLRRQNILLIAIKIIYHDIHNKIIIDGNEIKRRLKNDGLEREVILNPVTPKEISRLTDAGDQLIVFALNQKQLDRQLKNVVF